jgi:hypothetical protein
VGCSIVSKRKVPGERKLGYEMMMMMIVKGKVVPVLN